MIWHTASDFFYMGGYGWYVWTSFAITFLLLIIETISLKIRKNKLVSKINRTSDNIKQ